MCGATTVAMSQQQQFPCSCTVVAMSQQLQLPCCVNSTCRVLAVWKNAAWKQKMQVTWCSKSSCHVYCTIVAMWFPNVKCSMATKKCRWHGAANPVAMSSHNSCHHKWETQKKCLGQKSDYTDVYMKKISAEEMYLGRSALRTWQPSCPRPLAASSLQACLPGKQRQLA